MKHDPKRGFMVFHSVSSGVKRILYPHAGDCTAGHAERREGAVNRPLRPSRQRRLLQKRWMRAQASSSSWVLVA